LRGPADVVLERLTRIVGKQKAMDMILTSSTVTGKELEMLGVVARTFSVDELMKETMASAIKIASRSSPVVQLAKQAILNGRLFLSEKSSELISVAEHTSLDVGLQLERSLYYSSFSLEDRTEGMKAFIEKRQPVFKDR
jgi:enoyl-CoA hydratase/carnithine racemase